MKNKWGKLSTTKKNVFISKKKAE